MKKRNLFNIGATVMLLMLGACSSESELDDGKKLNDDLSKAGTIHFSLGGSAGEIGTKAINKITQSDDEKRVVSLHAIVFNDASGDAINAETKQEADNDTFYEIVDVLAGTGDLTSNQYTFKIPDPGHYHVCFVANMPASMVANIQAKQKGIWTISQFKALEIDKDPATKPGMVMTSEFYGVKLALSESYLGTIPLVRIMSRIDVYNYANDVVIQSIILKNRTEKSVLINNSFSHKQAYEVKETKYEDLNISGNSLTTAPDNFLKETIYSYEQYGTGDHVPAMDVIYYLKSAPNVLYKHTVAFQKTEDGVTEAIPLRRNYAYTISLNSTNGRMRIAASVAPWNEGTEWEIDDVTLMGNLQENQDSEK